MADAHPRRRYDSLRRTAKAQQTSAEIAAAARSLFVSKGWAATTVRDVAAEAGVSVPTVYAAYGNKAGLTKALADSADLSADMPRLLAELDRNPDPSAQLAAMAGYDRRLFERSGDVLLLVREAARAEPELAHTYRDARGRGDDAHRQVFTAWPPETLARGIDVASAVDIYGALCNIDVYTDLTEERGWTPERVERWWAETLVRELLR
ncbi:TetR/AcrR family transcriptional regulator [Nocardia callitridis]|uniref:TetR/AcrR family transcriptional regulator n=1 Tax=Nocardia callitridis TaxID=648753 RepID=A0ABP9KGV4_9NOCA